MFSDRESCEPAFIKIGEIPQIEIEAEKTVEARRIGCEYGFIVPRVLRLHGNELALERLANIRSLASLRGASARTFEIHTQVGRCLRAVHDHLVVGARIPLPAVLQGPDDVFIHGDLSTENVCIQDGSIVIIDWQMTGMHGGTATFGSRYFDVAWYVNNLFSRPSPDILHADRRARAFLSGYFEAPASNCSRDRFVDYHTRFRRYKLDLRKALPLARKVVMAPGHMLWRRFDPKEI